MKKKGAIRIFNAKTVNKHLRKKKKEEASSNE